MRDGVAPDLVLSLSPRWSQTGEHKLHRGHHSSALTGGRSAASARDGVAPDSASSLLPGGDGGEATQGDDERGEERGHNGDGMEDEMMGLSPVFDQESALRLGHELATGAGVKVRFIGIRDPEDTPIRITLYRPWMLNNLTNSSLSSTPSVCRPTVETAWMTFERLSNKAHPFRELKLQSRPTYPHNAAFTIPIPSSMRTVGRC
jgi:hypothetical protein